MHSESGSIPVPVSRALEARYDVVVLGGGLAGLSLALQVRQARSGTNILVLERRSFLMPEAAHKVGSPRVESSAEYFSNVLGLKGAHRDRLPEERAAVLLEVRSGRLDGDRPGARFRDRLAGGFVSAGPWHLREPPGAAGG